MASLKDVYDLVHSLNKREKIQFNLYANALGGKAKESYINDYQCFLAFETYNKTQLKTKLNALKKRRNLSQTNTNLYYFILYFLVSMQSKNDKKVSFLKDIQAIDILFQKGLIEQSQQLFNKTKAQKISNVGLEYYLLDMEDLLHFYQFKNETIHSTKINLIDQQLNLIEKTKISLELRKVKIQFFDLANNIGTPRTVTHIAQYKALTKSIDLLHMNFDLIPSSSYTDYFMINFLLQITTKTKLKEEDFQILEKGIKIVSNINDLSENYLPSFLLSKMYMQSAVIGQSEQKAKKSIDSFKSLQPYFTALRHQVSSKTAIHFAYLMLYLNFEHYKKGYEYLKENTQEIKDDSHLKYSPQAYTNYLAAARLCFLNKDYVQSLEFIEQLLNMKKEIRKSLLPHIYILYLLNHYKQKNTLYLPYAIRTSYRYILKSGHLYEPEKAILSFLKKTVKTNNLQDEIKKLYIKLKRLKKNVLNATFFGNGDYLKWLEAEINQSK